MNFADYLKGKKLQIKSKKMIKYLFIMLSMNNMLIGLS